jgi:hypothetical protein
LGSAVCLEEVYTRESEIGLHHRIPVEAAGTNTILEMWPGKAAEVELNIALGRTVIRIAGEEVTSRSRKKRRQSLDGLLIIRRYQGSSLHNCRSIEDRHATAGLAK